MAATYTLSGNPKTLLGSEDFERVRAYIKCDQPILTDPDTGEVRLIGEADLILAGATSTEFEVELPGNGWTPSPHFYTIYVEGRSRTTGTNRVVSTAAFEMTAAMTLGDLPQAAPQAITVTDYESLIAARDEAVAAAEVFGAAIAWAKNPDNLVVGALTYSSGLLTSAAVVWPDAATGTFTVTSRQAGTDAVTGYTITRVVSGEPNKTYTQPTITRDSLGNATNVPQITVA